ncbi:hypothetical protein [Vibrio gallaecicus]|nr:hypothetical protein [Vibrio gallaecicus]MDN3613898.1 hypothetical protein [Vibrio gallaecicus]
MFRLLMNMCPSYEIECGSGLSQVHNATHTPQKSRVFKSPTYDSLGFE